MEQQYIANSSLDLIDYQFDHAVNDWTKLNESLAGRAHCIEADIIMDKAGKTAKMAHPPATDSDLTFAAWLSTILHANTENCSNKSMVDRSCKTIKLDFKHASAIPQCLDLLNCFDDNAQNRSSRPPPPPPNQLVILNADVVKSTQNSADPIISVSRFCELCPTRYRTNNCGPFILSVGWTTIPRHKLGYSWGCIFQMFQQLNASFAQNNSLSASSNSKFQGVTFPVRLDYLVNSLCKLAWLLTRFTHSTLTVWSAPNDRNNVEEAAFAYRALLPNQSLYFDLPDVSQSDFNRLREIKSPQNAMMIGSKRLLNRVISYSAKNLIEEDKKTEKSIAIDCVSPNSCSTFEAIFDLETISLTFKGERRIGITLATPVDCVPQEDSKSSSVQILIELLTNQKSAPSITTTSTVLFDSKQILMFDIENTASNFKMRQKVKIGVDRGGNDTILLLNVEKVTENEFRLSMALDEVRQQQKLQESSNLSPGELCFVKSQYKLTLTILNNARLAPIVIDQSEIYV